MYFMNARNYRLNYCSQIFIGKKGLFFEKKRVFGIGRRPKVDSQNSKSDFPPPEPKHYTDAIIGTALLA
jgi:hypothetical protein